MNYFFFFFIINILILSPFHLLGQESKKLDYLFLKGNSYLRGTILDTLSDGSVTFKLLIGTELIFKKDDILRHKKSRNRYFIQHGRYLFPTNGFYYTAQLSLGVFIKKIEPNSYFKRPVYTGVQLSAGYQLRPYLSIGVGFGAQSYSSEIPAFLEMKGGLNKKKIAPIYGLQIGHTFVPTPPTASIGSIPKNTNFFIFPSVGIRVVSLATLRSELTVGIKNQYKELDTLSLVFGNPGNSVPGYAFFNKTAYGYWNHHFVLALGITF